MRRRSEWKIFLKDWITLTFLQGGAHDIMDRAAAVAFFTTFSVFPALLLILSVLHLLGQDTLASVILPFVKEIAPDASASVISWYLNYLSLQGALTRSLGVGVVGLIWASSMALSSLMHAIHRAYALPYRRPLWITRLRALGVFLIILTWGGVTLLILALFPSHLPAFVVEKVPLVRPFTPVLVTFVFALVAALILYTLAPSRRLALRYHLPGALFFAVSWIIGTKLFVIYMERFAAYTRIYGALASILISLSWAYFSALLFLIGAELNSALLELLEHPEKVASR